MTTFQLNKKNTSILFAFIIVLIQLIASFTSPLSAENAETRSHYVLVSVAPYKYFVEQIAGDTLKTGVMVPAGASIHTYEPTPREMVAASNADVWFIIGEGFETKAIKAFKSHNPRMAFVDLRQGVDLIQAEGHHCCKHHGSEDLHIWLSTRESKVQANNIAHALIQLYPENRELYLSNLQIFLQALDELDREMAETLMPLKSRVIMVSHPAYAYLCRDYNLHQIAIEFEGKDPTPLQLTKVMDEARKNKVGKIYIQMQYNNKGARLIAEHLGAKVVTLDPYSEKYIQMMREIAHQFAAP